MKRILLFMLLILGTSLSEAQTKEELEALKAEKQDSIDALTSKVDALQAEIDALPGWRLRATGTIGGSVSGFNNWYAKDKPNASVGNFGVNVFGFADLIEDKFFWKNAMNINIGWVKFDDRDDDTDSDNYEVANDIFNAGADVILSGIDTTEAIVVAGQRAEQGETAWAIPYDYEGACEEAPEICLGVPYFNWGPAYLEYAQKAQGGSFEQEWIWAGPDWTDLNNPDTTAVGFIQGEGLTADDAAQLDEFIAGLADGSIVLFVGPLNYQDGSVYLADGEVASDEQIWYTKQLLEGMTGPSE